MHSTYMIQQQKQKIKPVLECVLRGRLHWKTCGSGATQHIHVALIAALQDVWAVGLLNMSMLR